MTKELEEKIADVMNQLVSEIEKSSEKLGETAAERMMSYLNFIHGFVAGEKTRLDLAWHDKTEEPERDKRILAEVKYIDIDTPHFVVVRGGHESSFYPITRWAYIEDLIPKKRKEEQQ